MDEEAVRERAEARCAALVAAAIARAALHSGKPIHAAFVALHWPAYWHYDVLAGLRVLRALNLLADERAADALDLLESRRLPDGRFRPGGSWWEPRGTRTRDAVDWGRGGPSPPLTLHALAVLKDAGRV